MKKFIVLIALMGSAAAHADREILCDVSAPQSLNGLQTLAIRLVQARSGNAVLLGGKTQAGKETGNQKSERQRLKDSHGDSGQIGCLLCLNL